jgi:uncharacterized protein
MKRRNVLKLLGAGLATVGAYAIWIEPEQIAIAHHNLRDHFTTLNPTPKFTHQTLRIVQISDLHIKRLDRFNRNIADRINQQQADLILFTGDIVDRSQNLPVLKAFLQLIDPKPAKYAILGNWEHYSGVNIPELKTIYAQFNCPLLINESLVHQHQGRALLITGLDDTVEGQPNLTQALANVQPTANHLILAHAPDQRDLFTPAETQLLNQYQPQLMLSGHTHGGQIRFLNFAPALPHGSGNYISGWYGNTAPQLYVSRGLGGSSIRARFGATPEIVVFEWTLASAGAQPTG